MGMIYGYIGPTLSGRALDQEIMSLERAGATVVYFEGQIETEKNKALKELISDCDVDDVVLVMHLSRFGDAVASIVQVVRAILRIGAHIRSLGDDLDTRGDFGSGIAIAFAALDENRRQMSGADGPGFREISEAPQRSVGRPSVSATRLHYALNLVARGRSFVEVANQIGCSVATIYRFQVASEQSRRC
jgi:DNA invertase Pin-like site-specific DNA recombinase